MRPYWNPLFLALLLALGGPGISEAATAFVQRAQVRDVDAGATASIAYGSNVTQGSATVGALAWSGNSVTLTALTVCGNDAMANVVDNPTQGSTTIRGAGFYYPNMTGGACTIAATVSSGVAVLEIIADEVSGAHLTTPLDAHAAQGQTNPGTGTDAVTSGLLSPTPSVDGDYIFAATFNAAGVTTITPGTDFSQGLSATTRESGFYIQPTAAAHAATFTASNNDVWVTFGLALKVPSAAGSAPAQQPGIGWLY